jgi:hypothetical protein
VAVKHDEEVQKYLEIVSAYETEFKKWEGRVTKILKRYRDDTRGASGNETAKFNILWANVQTLKPAVYARMPKADVSRRFVDNDPVGRVAALLLERTLDYEIEHFTDFRSCMDHSVEDRFLGGRGVGWARYDPTIETVERGDEISDVAQAQGPEETDDGENLERITGESSPTDYVHWKEFGHEVSRTWEEVTKVWRWVYLTETQVTKRFGEEIAKKLSFDQAPDSLNKYTQQSTTKDRARICELWDMDDERVYWFSKHYPSMIDEVDDPLELEGFFPCGKPLYATTTSDSLVPVPDFVLYQDQANDLDILADRIDGLVKALRVRGVYDQSQPALQRLLTEGENNTLIPVDKWLPFVEKGGIKGSIDILPIDTLAACLLQCYQAQANVKQQIYDITGISDIIRGVSVASETATAQEIKGQYAGLRLKSMQDSVALFASDLLKLKAQIICSKYQPQTILEYAAADQMTAADRAMVPHALQLLTSNPLRKFRIEVEADSLVMLDEQQDKTDRMEFLKAFGAFMPQAVSAGQQIPEMAPALMQIMQYAVSGFKQARSIEGTIDTAMQQLQTKAAQLARNPKPTPEQLKAQMEAQNIQAQGQVDQAIENIKTQAQLQVAQAQTNAQIQIEQMRVDHQSMMKAQETAATQAFNKWKEEFDNATKIQVAMISSGQNAGGPAEQATNAAAENIIKALGESVKALADHVSAAHQNLGDMHAKAMQQIGDTMKQAAGPKRIVRGPDGRAIGVEPVTMQ